MDDLLRRVANEKEYIAVTLDNLSNVLNKKEKSFAELAAIATCLHNIYNGIENILKQVHKARKRKIKKSVTWHIDLLKISVESGFISEEIGKTLRDFLAFRHLFIHNYSFRLDEAQLVFLAHKVPDTWTKFIDSIEEYCKKSPGDNK